MAAADLVHELAQPAVFGGAGHVEVVQTHLSVVCLVDDRVFKFKKPLRLSFVDFTTLAARRAACREEVRLNRRLAPGVYVGTAALRRGPQGLGMASPGDDDGPDDVDVAVVMTRLPQPRMLDELLASHAVGEGELRDLARIIAAFHARADRGPAVLVHGDPRRLLGFARANFPELAAALSPGVAAPLRDAVAAASARAMASLLPALERRAANGRVVDGHGDLHARNICMTSPPVVYDCIEFEPAFRCGDVATEVAFLVMDLRYRGALSLARTFVDEYVAVSGDDELPQLLPPLCAYRAMVRAKVAALAAAEPELSPPDRDGAAASALRHLRHAALWLLEAAAPRWIVLCGPPATGKSTLAAVLAGWDWPVVATDVVRKELGGLDAEARGSGALYTAAFDDATYAAVVARAAATAAAGAAIVVLDGNFATRARRQEVQVAARQAGAEAVFACVSVPRAAAIARAVHRAAGPSQSDADAAVTAARHDAFESPDEIAGQLRIDIDGSALAAVAAETLLVELLFRASGTASPSVGRG